MNGFSDSTSRLNEDKRLEDIETLDGSTKSVLFNIIDTFLRDAKARKAYAH